MQGPQACPLLWLSHEVVRSCSKGAYKQGLKCTGPGEGLGELPEKAQATECPGRLLGLDMGLGGVEGL